VVRTHQQHVVSLLQQFRDAILQGRIVAVKGSGGFQLICDATSCDAVNRLPDRKRRQSKPFAVLVPDSITAESHVQLNALAMKWLCTPVAPIVICRRRIDTGEPSTTPVISSKVSFVDKTLGVMLPSSPLYYLLMDTCKRPLVVTSGNFSEEPMVVENHEAWTHLRSIADDFLFHDLDIVQSCDDSVVRTIHDESIIVRLARGLVPIAFPLHPTSISTADSAHPTAVPETVESSDHIRAMERANTEIGLALGSDLKTALCVSQAGLATLYQPIGDSDYLETLRALETFQQQIQRTIKVEYDVVLCDSYPDYVAHDWAQRFSKANGCSSQTVQHHQAHIAALVAENWNCSDREICGFVFDGTGYGEDGTSMGGEVLTMHDGICRRIGHLKHLLLPGGDICARHPVKTALATLASCGLAWDSRLACVQAVDKKERTFLAVQLERRANCILSSSMGRLFDAIASILGVCHINELNRTQRLLWRI